MKKIYSTPTTMTNIYQMKWNLMEETAQEVLAKRREEELELEEEEEELMEFLMSNQEEKTLW